jgi:S1-C subfamily serine protease
MFLKKGVEISSINDDSKVFSEGLRKGMIITQINGKTINSVEDYVQTMEIFKNLDENSTQKIIITTDQIEVIGLYNRSILNDIS